MVNGIKKMLIKNYPNEADYYENLHIEFIPDFIVGGHQYVPAIESFLSKKGFIKTNQYRDFDPFTMEEVDIKHNIVANDITKLNNFIILAPFHVNHSFDEESNDSIQREYLIGENTYKLIMVSSKRTDINKYYYAMFNNMNATNADITSDIEYDLYSNDFDEYTLSNDKSEKIYNCMVIKFKISKKILLNETKI